MSGSNAAFGGSPPEPEETRARKESPTRNTPAQRELPETVAADGQPTGDSQLLLAREDLLKSLPLDPPGTPDSLGRIGHYEVLNVVGRGGMGCVVRAFDQQLHRNVAVKLMSTKLISSENARQRFIREARSAASVNHPNVVTIHAVSEQHGIPYLVMEYVEGLTLQARIETDAPLEVIDVLRISSQVCEGLEAAHRQGLIHRDIKPSNVMLENGIERVKITDFGLARLVMEHSDLTSFGDLIGTPAFMSPEQVSTGEIDGRSDLFSLGCVMYAMIAGRSPFRGSTAIGTAHCVKSERHASLLKLHPKTPRYLVKIIDRLLEKDPAARFQSAAEIGGVLRAHYSDVNRVRIGGSTKTDDVTPRSVPTALRWLGAGLAAVAAVAVVSLMQNGSSSIREPAPDPRASISAVGADANVAPLPRAPRSWTVSKEGLADFQDIQEAVSAAGFGDAIQVLDAAEYQGPIVISDAERLAGLRLIAVKDATLAASIPGAVLTVEDTPGVRVEGFRIRPGPDTQGLSLRGDLTSGFFHKLDFEQADGAAQPNIVLWGGCHGSPGSEGELLTIRQCRVKSAYRGVLIDGTGADETDIANILIDGNYMHGSGAHLTLKGSVRNLRLEHNVIHGGEGVRIQLDGPRPSADIAMCCNTFFRVGFWLMFADNQRNYGGIACDNLILETPDDAAVGNLLDWATPWSMHHNLWERDAPLSRPIPPDMIAVVQDAGIRSRIPDEPGFLRPEADGPAATGGAGLPFSDYVGAMAPLPSP